MNAFPFTNCITQPIYFITLSLPPPLILAPWTLLSPSVFYPSLPFPQFLPSPLPSLPLPFPLSVSTLSLCNLFCILKVEVFNNLFLCRIKHFQCI